MKKIYEYVFVVLYLKQEFKAQFIVIECLDSEFLLTCIKKCLLNPYFTNGFSHHYQLGDSTFIFRGFSSDFYFLSHFLMKFFYANRIAPDGTPHSVASHLGLYCLPMSHKRDARLL